MKFIDRKISISDIWRMGLEHEINFLVNREELTFIIKNCSLKYYGKSQITNFDFDGFCSFLIILSIFIYSRNNKIYNTFGKFLQTLIEYIQAHSHNKDEIPYFHSKQKITPQIYSYNKALIKNPNLELPPVNLIKLFF